ncbi:UDP-N-acetylmuramate dehydrogenase [Candidatus Babeliales bacterium]|nr:UDP-N-acetylmuramate dehydrogenase [Candidatus Babeliales bacterium]
MQIFQNVPLRDKNWFGTGGPAKFFCEPENDQAFVTAIKFAQNNKLQIFVLGEGANTLISDEGFDGLVIRPQLKEVTIDDSLITAGAGITIENLINFCLDNNLVGLEEFSGIPGTLGGSVFINIHYFEFLLSKYLLKAKVVSRSREILEVDNGWFEFGYNTSKLHLNNHFLINATLKLKKSTDMEAAYAKGRRDEIIRHRYRRYPISKTCGSFFRNFKDEEIQFESDNKKILNVAYYFDKLGIKGKLRVGNASVSPLHANMLVNNGDAKSSDIINIAKTMQIMVYKNFKILPIPECRLIGFKKSPLYTDNSIPNAYAE